DPHRVDPVGRNRQTFGNRQVGGREAQFPASRLAPDDLATEAMRTPEQRSGGCDISLGQEGSDAGRRDDTTRVGDEVDGSHLESEPVSLLLQGDHVAGSITPETEVGPDTHQPGLAPIDQYLLRELSGEHLSYLSEIEKAHPIHAQFVEQLHTTFDGGQEGRSVLRGENAHGMGIEAHDTGLPAFAAASVDEGADHGSVAPVDSVEDTDRDTGRSREDPAFVEHVHATTTSGREVRP